ncbi:MAG: DUF2993 domain-containing protein [Lapillicoccus sp.]
MSAAKTVTGLVVLAAVLGGGAYAGDRYAEGQAEAYARQVVSDSIPVTSTPTVDITGFPFLTQALRGTLEHVTGSVGGATLGGIPVTNVQLDATSVLIRPPAGQQPRAGHATVAATIPTASVEKVVQDRTGFATKLAVAGNALTASATILNLPLELALVPRVDAGKLLVDVQSLKLNGATVTADQLPSAFRSRVQGIEVPVDGLPKGLALSNAVVAPDGVRITTDGTDVEVPQTTAARSTGAARTG